MLKYLTELDGESSPITLQEPAYQLYTEPLASWQQFQIFTGSLTTNKREAVKNKALTTATFLETKSNEDQNNLDIYTDESTCKTTKKTTCAVFNAQLAAIKQAFTLTYNQDWNEITIYTDSKSAITAISNFKWKSSNYIPEIIQQINNFRSAGMKINLFWMPNQIGILVPSLCLFVTPQRIQLIRKLAHEQLDIKVLQLHVILIFSLQNGLLKRWYHSTMFFNTFEKKLELRFIWSYRYKVFYYFDSKLDKVVKYINI
ncbi:hypothetical protein DAPPUDRAFT_320371 [Daphnia pulex]|uniref:Uncharacterized protein n=1 Tax=Daphnia pulex TaxID=6669 RepID=E9GPN8_DAPPU|nr:hypothetical protein DAPPUDRAFT_320371 [Daphnia pulex]|eukprot:EFX78415.1 hypothetical protein DAPPUDRAFT_320371 [Daphnia pulex]